MNGVAATVAAADARRGTLALVVMAGCGRIGFGDDNVTGDCQRLPIIYRDFLDSHPDFGFVNAVLDPNIVAVQLGDDGLPSFDQSGTHPSINSASSFLDWYRDRPENKRVDDVLERTGDSYGSAAFFPLDGLGFATDPMAHNYLFTALTRGRFVVEPGQTLMLSSDDDAWLFVNRRLAIDLGGVHVVDSRTFAIDDLGLDAGMTVDVDLFYAERGPVEAQLILQLGGIGCLTGRRY